MNTDNNHKMGFFKLTSININSIVGAGVFALPQVIAAYAYPIPALMGWIISGAGLLFVALSYAYLPSLKPELDSGPYAYARAGFGNLIGFVSAWGYWLATLIAMSSLLSLLYKSIEVFFPFLHEYGIASSMIIRSATI